MIPRDDLEYVLTHTRALWEGLRGRRIFITGGTGFVGTWLVESFRFANDALGLEAGAVVLTRDAAAFRARAPHLANDPALELLEGNAVDFRFPRGPFACVVHAATERFFEPDAQRPLSIFTPDAAATRRVLELTAATGAERLLFTSSGAVYGPQPADLERIPETYSGAPSTTDPRSIYGQSKRASEFACAMYAAQFGFTAAIARLFAFVGPRFPLDEAYAVGNFVRDVLAGGPIRIAGDGTAFRSYLYAADLAVWLWTILFRGTSGRAYNVGSPEGITIRELAEAVVAATDPGTAIEIARDPVPGTPPNRYVPDVRRAENELGLVAGVPVGEGIRRMYRWHRDRAHGFVR